jgi:signal transduction histidine kinase
MKAAEANQPGAGDPLPLPGRQFQRFILVFHVVFIAAMGFILLNRWQRAGSLWGRPEVILTLLIGAQIALYLAFFAWPFRAPRVIEWWGFYFPVSFTLWFITWRLEPPFEWMVLGYLGQMFGAIPPRYSLAGGAAVFLVYFPVKIGWAALGHLTLREWFAYLSLAVGWTALGLFLHKLVITSAERAKLLQELQAARTQLELSHQRETELAALRERERLARELHDSLGHGLVTLTVQLEAAQRLCASEPQRAAELLEQMKQLTRTSMEQLRRSLAGLRAPGLGERALPGALEELCTALSQRTQIKVECRTLDNLDHFSPAVLETLWRVAQEGLANVERHAQARTVQLSVQLEGAPQASPTAEPAPSRHVTLRVADDGLGVPPDAEAKAGHYGLRGLRERVECLGGTLTIRSRQPQGTILEARLPVMAHGLSAP